MVQEKRIAHRRCQKTCHLAYKTIPKKLDSKNERIFNYIHDSIDKQDRNYLY